MEIRAERTTQGAIRQSAADYGYAHARSRKEIEKVRKQTLEFKKKRGRRPRILIARMQAKGSERLVKVIAADYADLGFDVDVHTHIRAPERIAKMAVENDVHAIGTVDSPLQARYPELMSRLAKALEKEGGQNILIAPQGSGGCEIGKHRRGQDATKPLDRHETVARYALHLLKEIEKINEPY